MSLLEESFFLLYFILWSYVQSINSDYTINLLTILLTIQSSYYYVIEQWAQSYIEIQIIERTNGIALNSSNQGKLFNLKNVWVCRFLLAKTLSDTLS